MNGFNTLIWPWLFLWLYIHISYAFTCGLVPVNNRWGCFFYHCPYKDKIARLVSEKLEMLKCYSLDAQCAKIAIGYLSDTSLADILLCTHRLVVLSFVNFQKYHQTRLLIPFCLFPLHYLMSPNQNVNLMQSLLIFLFVLHPCPLKISIFHLEFLFLIYNSDITLCRYSVLIWFNS